MSIYQILFLFNSEIPKNHFFWIPIIFFLSIFAGIWVFLLIFGGKILRKVLTHYFLIVEKAHRPYKLEHKPQFYLYKYHPKKHVSGILLDLKEDGSTLLLHVPSGKERIHRLSSPEDFAMVGLYKNSPSKALTKKFIGTNGGGWILYARLEKFGVAFVEISQQSLLD